ncbi:MAG: putative porin [Chthoniobacteraceae bacterium]
MTRSLPTIRRSFALLLAGTCCAATLQSLHAQTPGASPSASAQPSAAPAESAPVPSQAAPVVPAPGSSPASTASPDAAAKAVDISSTTLTGTPGAPVSKSQNVTINLINRLVQRGVLSKEDAADLIKQAEADAEDAKAQAEATQAASDQAAAAAQAAASAQAAVAQANSNPLAPEFAPSGDDMRVTYIPEVVKAQLRDEIKGEVMAAARDEKWTTPGPIPDWVSHIRLFGDVRVRYEGDFFPGGNDNTGSFPNFNAINTGSPYDVSGTSFAPS